MNVLGYNYYSELGIGHRNEVKIPTLLHRNAFGGLDVVMASAGENHAGCVTSTGSLWMWGCADHGAVGVAPDDYGAVGVDPGGDGMLPVLQLVPRQVFTQAPVIMVSCGYKFTMILTREKQVWTCGVGRFGQLGHNDTESRNSFTQIDHQVFGAGATVTMVAAGYGHSMALTRTTAGNTLWTWGSNEDGQLGHGDREHRLLPVSIPATTFGDVPVVNIDGGYGHSLVVTADGSLWGSGSDAFGQLGLHAHVTGVDFTARALTMQKVVGPEFADYHGVLMAACGQFHSVVLAKNHTVWVCGSGKCISVIPYADYTRSLTLIDPARFHDKKIFIVAAGNSRCGAVTEDGDVWVWGQQEPSVLDLHACAGRWHNTRPEHTLAFMMLYNMRLGAEASEFACALPDCLVEDMFSKMQFKPHADTPDGLLDRMGRRLPRRVTALEHEAPVLPDDHSDEQ